MTATTDHPSAAPAHPRRRTRTRTWAGLVALVVALGAGAALLLMKPDGDEPRAAARAPLATVWPRAQRADIPGNLPDGPVFQPGIFLDARTAIGTAPSPDGESMRLVLRDPAGSLRELRRLPLPDKPAFDNFATDGDEVVWTEFSDANRVQIWGVNLRTGDPPRRLTADTGDPVFYGSQYDLVVADGRVHWVAAGTDEPLVTEVRSIALTGGDVTVREEPGAWSLTTWPWLTNGGNDGTGTTVLRDLSSNREIQVNSTGTELPNCSPVWCRVMVMSYEGLVRIDVMHPDGTARRQIAGRNASAAVTDVGILDRFEILAEPQPDSDLTGTEALLVYDIAAGRTVDLSVAAGGAFCRGGVLWWSTGDQDNLIWHTLDLRTV